MPSPYRTTYTVTQPYGPTTLAAEPAYGGYAHYHRGVDTVASPWNADLYSITSGVVYAAATDTDGAKYVIIRGDSGNWFCYWHLSEIACKAGDKVTPDSRIGKQGSTGNSTGPHLHLEIHQPGTWKGLLGMTPIDPTLFLEGGTTPKPTMTPRDFILAMYALFQPDAKVGDDVINNHATYVATLSLEDLKAWIRIFALSGANQTGSLIQDRAAEIAGLQAQLDAANKTNASLRSTIDQKAQELASQALDQHKDDAFKAAYRTQANQDAPAQAIEDWKETDLSAPDWVRKFVGNADVKEIRRQLDEATAAISKLTDTLDNQKAALANLASQASTSEAGLLEAKASVATLTKQLETERLTAETLRTQLAASESKAKPVNQLTLIQLFSEIFARLKGGANQ